VNAQLIPVISLFAFFLMATGCTTPPFSYSSDRCLGSYNQCSNSCASIQNGPAQSACYQRCTDRQSTCYTAGDDGAGSSLAQESLIGLKKSEAEKQADYERWKANKEKENAETNHDTP